MAHKTRLPSREHKRTLLFELFGGQDLEERRLVGEETSCEEVSSTAMKSGGTLCKKGELGFVSLRRA